jgi:hypothetical protein
MNRSERFKKLIEYLIANKIVRNQQEFVEDIGSDKATVSQIKNGKLDIPNNLFVKIKSAYPELNIEWLMKGEGEMVKSIQKLENVNSSVAIGRDANGSEIHITSQKMDEFIRIMGKNQEHTDRMLAIIEKLINK